MDVRHIPAAGTLVLVTDQFACERIIKSARTVADMNSTGLLVLSVMRTRETANPDALEHLFGVAKAYGAVMTVAFSDQPFDAIIEFANQNHVINVVTGVPSGKESMLVGMWKSQKNLNFFTVTHEGEVREVLERVYQSPQQQVAVERFLENGMCM